jgi:Tfp pilus assembly protein PilF
MVSALATKKIESPALFSTCAGVLASSDADQHQRAALGLYEKAIALSPRSSPPRLQLALLHYHRGEVDQAEKSYRELLSVDPNNSQALNDLAWILSQDRRDYKAALELSDRGLTLDSDNVHLRDTRGVILRNLHRPKDALRDFEQLLILAKLPHERAKALLQLARTCAELNKGAETKRYLDEALQLDHQSPVFSPKERAEIDQLKSRIN